MPEDTRKHRHKRYDKTEEMRKKIADLAHEQESLSKTRKDVLVERTAVLSSGKAAQAQRAVTSNAEAQFMNLFRDFFHRHQDDFSDALKIAYNKVVEERDKLGWMDEEYFQAERSLGGSEWLLMEQEDTLYQYQLQTVFDEDDLSISEHHATAETTRGLSPSLLSLSPPPPPPPPSAPYLLNTDVIIVHGAPTPPLPPLSSHTCHTMGDDTASADSMEPTLLESQDVIQQYEATLSDLCRLKREFDALRPEQTKLLESRSPGDEQHSDTTMPTRNPDFYHRYSSVLTKISKCEVQILHLKEQYIRCSQSRSFLDAQVPSGRSVYSNDIMTKVGGDRTLAFGAYQSTIEDRIEDWLLELLRSNAIERTIYLNILERWGISFSRDASLQDGPEEYWPVVSTRQTFSNPVSIPHTQKSFREHLVQPSSITKAPNELLRNTLSAQSRNDISASSNSQCLSKSTPRSISPLGHCEDDVEVPNNNTSARYQGQGNAIATYLPICGKGMIPSSIPDHTSEKTSGWTVTLPVDNSTTRSRMDIPARPDDVGEVVDIDHDDSTATEKEVPSPSPIQHTKDSPRLSRRHFGAVQ
ncbi:hypothetical protein P280DRAFT_475101 [Massarina eburnea CBS 473.64]|uniref:Uncharacterized protein n=1 Tax=Massarina eburnea CBS 473.64 TaxID=1395130 RepID=A0A6A6SEB3_9PLEO|nr:hypothetical protein P280DRAFT_475101 [Massarina eburnea CBS 473.64]